MLGSTHENHGSPVFDRLNELTRKLNQLMRELQMIRQEIERRLEEDSRQGGRGAAKEHDHNYGATSTSSASLTGMTLEGLLQRGKGLCEQIKNVIHELEQNQLRAKKQSCASSLKVAGETFKASLRDFIDLEGRYRDLVDDRVKDSRRRGFQLPPPDANKGFYNQQEEAAGEQRAGGRRQRQKENKNQVAVPIGGAENKQGAQHQYERLQELANQNAAMLQFEQQVTMLNEMMQYCDALCEEQSRILENIEQHVDATDEYVGEAVIRLEEAEEHQASYLAKRRMLFWGALSFCVLGIIVLVLLSVFCFA
eukprot:CAMPEP_0179008626 /NCGR_PEP_ID=MMETSP0795-20121207/15823_1 /TAXON_ID=88552 /ORGANISM="Amoebophrya sp., Strain Ameob2" /LENGTH=308 /DNA_ID=CAMNT_0020703737 /DNA_START=185 /DNA_END=1107 /DNA_ORIENTATION=+